MSWAARRRLLITLIAGVVAIAILSLVFVSVTNAPPSCFDNITNQGESGIDCGGPCTLVCTAEASAPVVLFTKALTAPGRVDVVALIENKNPHAAARAVPYTISLFAGDQTLVQEVRGAIDLPPGSRVPVYVPRIPSGNQAISRAFLSLDTARLVWYRFDRTTYQAPRVVDTVQEGDQDTPRIIATLANDTVKPMRDVQVVVFVRDEGGNIIAASQTIVSLVPAQGKGTAIFSWNTPFSVSASIIEVMPLVPLGE